MTVAALSTRAVHISIVILIRCRATRAQHNFWPTLSQQILTHNQRERERGRETKRIQLNVHQKLQQKWRTQTHRKVYTTSHRAQGTMRHDDDDNDKNHDHGHEDDDDDDDSYKATATATATTVDIDTLALALAVTVTALPMSTRAL